MTDPPAPSDAKSRQILLLAWAISATVLALVSTGLALFFALRPREARDGPAGWSRWETSAGGNGHWYKAALVPNGITWTEAAKLARAEGGYLATLTSEAENAFVFNLVNAPEFFANSKGPALGGFQQDGSSEPAGGWGWITGEPWNYSNWDPGEPNNSRHHTGREDRLAFNGKSAGRPTAAWNDLHRDDETLGGYVMERND